MVSCRTIKYGGAAGRGVASSIRAGVLRTLRSATKLEFEMEQAAQIIEDERGDYLDAVLSATAAAAAWADSFQGVPSTCLARRAGIHSVREEPWR